MSARQPMRVLLIGNYQPDDQESMQRFAQVLSRHLLDRGVRIDLIRPEPLWGGRGDPQRGLGKWLGYVDKFLIFPKLLRTRTTVARGQQPARPVVHICDHSNALYTRYLRDVPHLVTCNDLLAVRSALGEVPENRTRWSGRQLQRLILAGLKRAQHIACISQATRKEVLRLCRIDPHRVSVNHMGLNYTYCPMPAAEARNHLQRLLTTAPGSGIPLSSGELSFILHVGGNQWYKNRLGTLEIYRRLREQNGSRPKLMMVGKPFTSEMARFVEYHRLTRDVISITNCDNEGLRALYSLAELLLFPSVAEGFGWPIIEAHACGCRVVTVNRPPMTEVGGEAAVYIDPANTDGAAEIVRRILGETEPEKRARRIAGRTNAARFSTESMIDGYLELYQALAGEDPAEPALQHGAVPN
jgi:glycosyltransferase involved in cell wall biosynthesis